MRCGPPRCATGAPPGTWCTRKGNAVTDVTHEVFNQPEPLVGYNLFETNRPLRDALKFNSPGLDTAPLQALGALAGTAQMQAHARLANTHTPELRTHDRFGHRLDEVEFHPSYH